MRARWVVRRRGTGCRTISAEGAGRRARELVALPPTRAGRRPSGWSAAATAAGAGAAGPTSCLLSSERGRACHAGKTAWPGSKLERPAGARRTRARAVDGAEVELGPGTPT